MLWTSLRWNWGNTLVVAAFCLLAMLGAVNNASVLSDRDVVEAGRTPACIGLCDNHAQLTMGATRADVAPAMTNLLQPQPFAVN